MKDAGNGYMSDRIAYQDYMAKLEEAMEHKLLKCAPVYSSFWLLNTMKMLREYYSQTAWKEAMEALEHDRNK